MGIVRMWIVECNRRTPRECCAFVLWYYEAEWLHEKVNELVFSEELFQIYRRAVYAYDRDFRQQIKLENRE